MNSNGEHVNNFVQAFTVLFGTIYALRFEQWISLCVVLTGVATLLVNWHYKHKEYHLQKRMIERESRAHDHDKTNEESSNE